MHAMIKWGVQRGDLDADPMAAMETPGSFQAKGEISRRRRVAALRGPGRFPASVALALKIALDHRAEDRGSKTGITLDEIDFPKATLKSPAERSKNGAAHTIPLSPMALDLITDARRTAIGDRLFPGVNSMKVGQQLIRHRDRLPVSDFTAHDLRRSVCTHMAKMGISPLVIGAVVNHRGTTKSTVTNKTYIQYDFAREKREALEMWAERLSAIVAGDVARVIPMNRNVG